MPTKYPPSLDHVGFNWTSDLDELRSKLLARWDGILAELHFVERSDTIADSSGEVLGKSDRDCLFEEFVGVFALVAAVQMDGGFKATNKVIATVDAVSRDPSVVRFRHVEPEALAVIAANYQRADEPPGTYWFDIYQDENAAAIDFQWVARAARLARLQLQAEMKKGRPSESKLQILATFREIFERYNNDSGRHSVLTWVEGNFKQEETGPYFNFLKTAVEPLNEFLAGLPVSYGAKLIAPAQIMRSKVQHDRRRVKRIPPRRRHPIPECAR